jgi:hypothetical protein
MHMMGMHGHGHNGCMSVLGWAHLGYYFICTCVTGHHGIGARLCTYIKAIYGQRGTMKHFLWNLDYVNKKLNGEGRANLQSQ